MHTEIAPFTKEEIKKNAKVLSIMFYDLDPKELVLIGEGINMLAKTSCWPKVKCGYEYVPLDRQKGFLYAAYGSRLGLKLIDSLGAFFEINGRITLYGKAGKILIWRSGKCKRLDMAWNDETKTASCTIQRINASDPNTSEFSIADAETAGLIHPKLSKHSPWYKYPKDMCGWKAFWRSAFNQVPDVLSGIEAYEEAVDMMEENKKDSKNILVDETEKSIDAELLNVLESSKPLEIKIPEEVEVDIKNVTTGIQQPSFEMGIEEDK